MSKDKAYRPIFLAPCIIGTRKSVFYKLSEKVTIEAPGALIRKLIKACDGTRSFQDLSNSLSHEWDVESVRILVEQLEQHEIIADSRKLAQILWKASTNVSGFPEITSGKDIDALVATAHARHSHDRGEVVYPVTPSPLKSVLDRRRSTRLFSGEQVAFQSLVNMLWSAYGELILSATEDVQAVNHRRTVPSAGALYPLTLHLVLFKESEEFKAGIYEVHMTQPERVSLKMVATDTNRYQRAFLDPLVFEGTHGAIIISGSFGFAAEKYGNRSMLFVPLEAGHAAQNVHLSAVEHQVATLEIGAFVETLLAEAILLDGQYCPLTVIAFGIEDTRKTACTGSPTIDVDWATPIATGYRLPFSMAFARSKASSEANDWSSGKSLSPRMAHTKAVAEAQEWAACENVSSGLVQARMGDLEGSIDPRLIARFHKGQYKVRDFPYRPFKEDLEYAWVRGSDELCGKDVYVLGDHAFIGYTPAAPRYIHASSSGVAAHPDRQQALENGVLELIERDAFMISYLTMISRPTVTAATLPQDIHRRIRALEQIGFSLWVKDYSLDLAPVIFIFAQNKALSFTMCSASSNFDVQEALDHALMEIEGAVLIRLTNGPQKTIHPRNVRTPEDHGALYEQRPFFERANFLTQGPSTAFQKVGQGMALSWQALLDRFSRYKWRLITVPLESVEKGSEKELHIIRSIVPGLVPISFGYRQEPCAMERIYAVGERLKGMPITYAQMPRFPHPFT